MSHLLVSDFSRSSSGYSQPNEEGRDPGILTLRGDGLGNSHGDYSEGTTGMDTVVGRFRLTMLQANILQPAMYRVGT